MRRETRTWNTGGFLLAALAMIWVAATDARAGALDEIRARGKLIAGVKTDYKPFGYIDANGKHVGFDADIARLFAKALFGDEQKVEFVSVTSAARLPYLQTKKIDIAIATFGITEERKKLVEFSEPYFLGGTLVLVTKQSNITGPYDLFGKVVGALRGSTGLADIREHAPQAERVEFDKTTEAVFALRQGQTQAFAMDDALVLTMAHDNADLKAVGDPFGARPWAIAVRKGETEFVKWVNQQLLALRNDGTYDQLWEKHFIEVEAKLLRFKP
jgi:ABC-type amino acid transport substrate-binding protein